MPRKKCTDTPEVKALRKLLMSLGLSAYTASQLIAQMDGRLADLSAKACEVEMYIAAHPEVRSPKDYAAMTLKNYAAEQESMRDVVSQAAPVPSSPASPTVPSKDSGGQTPTPVTMELWGDDD